MPGPVSPATSIFLDHFRLTPERPDLRLLGEISYHFARLPWENLTKYLRLHDGRKSAPDERRAELPASMRALPGSERLRLSREVLEDHVRLGAGGTCFSLTHALMRILGDLGYTSWPAMADMRHGENIHCGLVVDLAGKRWLLDPGYLVAEPVPLVPGREAVVAHPGHRLVYRPVADDARVELSTVDADGRETPRYLMRPWAVPAEAFVRHWLASFDATGMNGLHLSRIAGEARLYAHDLNLRVDDGRRKRNVKLRGDYAGLIADRFGLDAGLAGRAHALWERRRCR